MEYQKSHHRLTIHHYADTGHMRNGKSREWEVIDGHEFDDQDTKRLRTWVEKSLKLEDAPVARTLLIHLNKIVYDQAVEQGKQDAIEIGHSRLHSVASGIWHDGYTEGFATAMSERYEEAMPHERSD